MFGSRRVDSETPLELRRLFVLTGFPIFGLDSLLVALRLFLGASADAELPMMLLREEGEGCRGEEPLGIARTCYDSMPETSATH